MQYYILAPFCFGAYYYYVNNPGNPRQYNVDLTGKIAIVTGASSGIGMEVAKELAAHSATVIFACRNEDKTLAAINRISEQTNNFNLHYLNLDLSDYDAVRNFVDEFKKDYFHLDILINNASTNDCGFNSRKHELTFATNHLGPFLLTKLLDELLADKARVINVSCFRHHDVNKNPDFMRLITEGSNNQLSYSKFANVLHAQALQQKFNIQAKNAKAVSLNPGWIIKQQDNETTWATWLYLRFVSLFQVTPKEGAYTVLYCALQDYERLVPGGYYERNIISTASRFVRSCGLEDELWRISEQMVKD